MSAIERQNCFEMRRAPVSRKDLEVLDELVSALAGYTLLSLSLSLSSFSSAHCTPSHAYVSRLACQAGGRGPRRIRGKEAEKGKERRKDENEGGGTRRRRRKEGRPLFSCTATSIVLLLGYRRTRVRLQNF